MIRTYRAFLVLATAGAAALAVGPAGAKSNAAPPVMQVAASVPASVVLTPAPVASPAAPAEVAPACARRVKVVYPGYGEATRAACDVASGETVR